MNKYLVFLSFAALCVCLIDAATKHEVRGTVKVGFKETRNEGTTAIKTAARDIMISATTPLQRVCASRKIGLANTEFNLELENIRNETLTEINSWTPEELESLDIVSWSQKIQTKLASAKAVADNWAQQIRNCA